MMKYGVDPEKRTAYAAVRTALRNGRLSVPDGCEECGDERPQLHAHHWAGYHRPLHIVWLCPRCHRRSHVRPGSVTVVNRLVDALHEELMAQGAPLASHEAGDST